MKNNNKTQHINNQSMLIPKPRPQYIRSPEHLARYQKYALEYLERYYDFEFGKTKPIIPIRLPPSQNMESSGTTGEVKKYLYSRPEYEQLEQYHFKKICHLNDLKTNLKIIRLYYSTKHLDLVGPRNLPQFNANVYEITYNLKDDINHNEIKRRWNEIFAKISHFKPDLLCITPSLFNIAYEMSEHTLTSINCPVLFSDETLFPAIREKAANVFPRIIDKMRCWDGGLSFIECKYGTKHIDDELCYVEKDLTSTDFFNYAQPFIRYPSADGGEIDIKQCRCGIYGRYFKEFIGKVSQYIIHHNGNMINPVRIIRVVGAYLRRYHLNFYYQIYQNTNGIIILKITNADPTTQAMQDLSAEIHKITGCEVKTIVDDSVINKNSIRQKMFMIYSDVRTNAQ
jgi:phenylacetate-coenzyme A ligase PaaK-like adenylate-forming protein